MKRATKDVLYFETGPDNPVTLRVQPGEEFEVETQLNRGPWLDDHPEGRGLRDKLTRRAAAKGHHVRLRLVCSGVRAAGLPSGNPSSGCIYVDGAKPGDAARPRRRDRPGSGGLHRLRGQQRCVARLVGPQWHRCRAPRRRYPRRPDPLERHAQASRAAHDRLYRRGPGARAISQLVGRLLGREL